MLLSRWQSVLTRTRIRDRPRRGAGRLSGDRASHPPYGCQAVLRHLLLLKPHHPQHPVSPRSHDQRFSKPLHTANDKDHDRHRDQVITKTLIALCLPETDTKQSEHHGNSQRLGSDGRPAEHASFHRDSGRACYCGPSFLGAHQYRREQFVDGVRPRWPLSNSGEWGDPSETSSNKYSNRGRTRG